MPLSRIFGITTIYCEGNNGASTNFTRTKVRPITGLFGSKLQFGTGALRTFVTGKVGFMDFSTSNTTSPRPAPFTGAVSSGHNAIIP